VSKGAGSELAALGASEAVAYAPQSRLGGGYLAGAFVGSYRSGMICAEVHSSPAAASKGDARRVKDRQPIGSRARRLIIRARQPVRGGV